MQRRDARGFLEEVLSQVPDLDPKMREELIALVGDKPGAKRAGKLAAIISGKDDESAE